MERLTYMYGGKWRLRIGDTEYSRKAVDRLAAYEGTGLEPEEIYAMRQLIEMQPAADVSPVRHGKNITKMHFSDEIICSICGFDGVGFSSYDPVEDICIEYECRYCPNCGARMDGEEKG